MMWQYYHQKSETWIDTCAKYAAYYVYAGIPVRLV